MGVAAYSIVRHHPLSPTAGVALCVGSAVAFIFYWKLAPHYGAKPYDPLTLDTRRLASYLENYVTGLLFAALLIGFDAIGSFALPVLSGFARQIRWISGATFSLYLFHWPVIELMVALSPSPPAALVTRSMVYVGTLLVVFVLAEFTERRKETWRQVFARMSRKCFGEPEMRRADDRKLQRGPSPR